MALSTSAGRAAAEKPAVKDMSDVFSIGLPLTYTPYRGTTAVAETTIRHQIFFDDLEGGTAGWNVINFRAGQPNAWHLASGTQSCVGNAWWCGQSGFTYGDGYDNNWVQKLTTNVPITLNGTSNNKLTFKYRCKTEYGFDWGWVMIRGNNSTKWDTLGSYSGDYGTSCNSATLSIPDSFTTVVQPVTLMFLFGSDLSFSAADSAGGFSGFSVDDVKIAAGTNVRFVDDMESGTSKWTTSSPDPGPLWHIENAPGTSVPSTCFFLSSNVWVPFQGSGFGMVPDFADAMLTTPPMDISGVFSPNTASTALRVQFDDWVNLPYDNALYWSLWIQGSNDKVTWTPWQNAIGLVFSTENAQCFEGMYRNFDPYDTQRSGVQPGTRYIRLGFRIRDTKVTNAKSEDDPGPLRLGFLTEGIYFDDIGVYYVYTISGVETVAGIPTGSRVAIKKVFPNPFNPSTKIEFSVPKEAPVAVRIFDIQGRHVATLVEKSLSPGVYRTAWNGKSDRGEDLGSGVYFAQIRSGATRQSVRLTMLK
jgi:hypothetical protein